jgi:hypothetical protein
VILYGRKEGIAISFTYIDLARIILDDDFLVELNGRAKVHITMMFYVSVDN